MLSSTGLPAVLVVALASPLSVAVSVMDGIGYSGGTPGNQPGGIAASVDVSLEPSASSVLAFSDVVAGRPPRPTPMPMPRPTPRPPWELS